MKMAEASTRVRVEASLLIWLSDCGTVATMIESARRVSSELTAKLRFVGTGSGERFERSSEPVVVKPCCARAGSVANVLWQRIPQHVPEMAGILSAVGECTSKAYGGVDSMRRRTLRLASIALALILSTVLCVTSQAITAAPRLVIDGAKSSIPLTKVNGVWMVPFEDYTHMLAGTVSYASPTNTYSVATANPSAALMWQRSKAWCVGLVVTKAEADQYGVTEESVVHGSGVLYSADGYIVTAEHVISSAKSIQVLFDNGRVLNGTVVGSDPLTDLALVKVISNPITPIAMLGTSSSVVVGQRVFTIGNPIGLRFQNSLSAGIVSGLGRDLGSGFPFMQIDAPINPGNSGGAVVNEAGALIGIATSKVVAAEVEGMGFAIPISVVERVADSLKQTGKFEHPWLGLSLDESWAAQNGLPSQDGPCITSLVKGGPCDKAGALAGDKLVSFDGIKLGSLGDLSRALFDRRPGDTVLLSVKRGGVAVSLRVTLGARPSESELASAISVYEAARQALTAKYQQSAVGGKQLRFAFQVWPDPADQSLADLYITVDPSQFADFGSVVLADSYALQAWLTSVARDAQAMMKCQRVWATVWLDGVYDYAESWMNLENLTPYYFGWRLQMPLAEVKIDGDVTQFKLY